MSPAYPDDRRDELADMIMTHTQTDKLYRFKSAILERFWARWKHEYLTGLQEFHKTSGQSGDFMNIGDIVQVHDNIRPRNQWLLGVVEDLILGRDGLVCAAQIKSRGGVITRPLSKLYQLKLNRH